MSHKCSLSRKGWKHLRLLTKRLCLLKRFVHQRETRGSAELLKLHLEGELLPTEAWGAEEGGLKSFELFHFIKTLYNKTELKGRPAGRWELCEHVEFSQRARFSDGQENLASYPLAVVHINVAMISFCCLVHISLGVSFHLFKIYFVELSIYLLISKYF